MSPPSAFARRSSPRARCAQSYASSSPRGRRVSRVPGPESSPDRSDCPRTGPPDGPRDGLGVTTAADIYGLGAILYSSSRSEPLPGRVGLMRPSAGCARPSDPPRVETRSPPRLQAFPQRSPAQDPGPSLRVGRCCSPTTLTVAPFGPTLAGSRQSPRLRLLDDAPS